MTPDLLDTMLGKGQLPPEPTPHEGDRMSVALYDIALPEGVQRRATCYAVANHLGKWQSLYEHAWQARRARSLRQDANSCIVVELTLTLKGVVEDPTVAKKRRGKKS